MSLINDLAGVETGPLRYPGPKCTVTLILDQIGPEDRAALLRLIDNPAISGARIAEALTKNGFSVTDKTVLRHRKRSAPTGCRCPKETA